MEIRPYDPDRDLPLIEASVSDRRIHALWCAGRLPYPVQRESFDAFLRTESETCGNRAFTAVLDGRAVGFFCLSPNAGTGEAMLKFVLVDGTLRGQGIGGQMLKLAAQYAFTELNAKAVQLMVFSGNEAALRCYTKAGFKERRRDAGAFRYESEIWDRCNMVLQNEVMI
ncbi:MAG: GNAT family N-acetyltransferase [Ruminococcus sp.]|nr:GNAT family N-acetyltransferase [Ruminococcus sp.]